MKCEWCMRVPYYIYSRERWDLNVWCLFCFLTLVIFGLYSAKTIKHLWENWTHGCLSKSLAYSRTRNIQNITLAFVEDLISTTSPKLLQIRSEHIFIEKCDKPEDKNLLYVIETSATATSWGILEKQNSNSSATEDYQLGNKTTNVCIHIIEQCYSSSQTKTHMIISLIWCTRFGFSLVLFNCGHYSLLG